MYSKQRTFTAIRHQEPDRVPLHIWLYQRGVGSETLKASVETEYGSLDAFYDAFDIDVFIYILPFPDGDYVPSPDGTVMTGASDPPLEEIVRDYFLNPNDGSLYDGLQQRIQTRGHDKAVIAHIWGVLEAAYSFMGVETTLLNLALKPDEMAGLFEQLGAWSAQVAERAIDLGADIVQISADAGASIGPLVNPRQWQELIYPNDKIIVEAIKRHGAIAAMHERWQHLGAHGWHR